VSVIIDDLQVQVTPEIPAAEAAASPAEGEAFERWLDLLELAREREARLVCD